MAPLPPYLQYPTGGTVGYMTVRRKIVVTLTQEADGFWEQFRATCRRRGVSYSRALAMGARLWLDQLHQEGFPVERSRYNEPGDWTPPNG